MTDKSLSSIAGVLAEWTLLGTFSCFLAFHTLPRAWKSLNTDFPNYYLASHLLHEGIDTSRAYEWRWLQRQKDHAGIDQRVIGLVPITPFSTLFVWPLSTLTPLTAKHVWLLLQLALLVPVGLALRSLSGLSLRRIAILCCACLPLHRNLVYGQFYILLLAMLVFACWAYVRKRFVLAGSLVAVAAATKIFPVIFLFYFLRKKSWTALVSATLSLLAIAFLSLVVFGWSMHRTYVETVLPATLRGEVLPPYVLASASISTLLHHLFVFEPQWNPRPWINFPAASVILQSLLQTIILAPALLLVRKRAGEGRIGLEWSALLVATLSVSTIPASYNFTLIIFPVVLLCGYLLPGSPVKAAAVIALSLAIGYPGWNTSSVEGLRAVLHVQRLLFLLTFTALCYTLLGSRSFRARSLRSTTYRWLTGFGVLMTVSVAIGLPRISNLYNDYKYRVAQPQDFLMSSDPVATDDEVLSIALDSGGYRLLSTKQAAPLMGDSRKLPVDQLSFASAHDVLRVEETALKSKIAAPGAPFVTDIDNAELPLFSHDGRELAYLRETRGRGQLFLETANHQEAALTPKWLNVEEAAFARDGSLIVAALNDQSTSHLYQVDGKIVKALPALGEARFPTASPDGKWLLYSRFMNGSWNLWLLDTMSQHSTQIGKVPCNQIEASWEADSKTILYASDCGRALWFTAICKRQIIP